MRLGGIDSSAALDAIPSGSLSLDVALGVGGFPRGRVIEIFGPESRGKTTLTLHVIAEAQKPAASRRSSTPNMRSTPIYARKLGVNLDNLLVSQPDTGEQALEIAEMLVRSGRRRHHRHRLGRRPRPPAPNSKAKWATRTIGLQARLMSQALRKLTGIVSKSKTCLVFINQIREKIGVMFGNPETTTGGRALKFYCLGPHRRPPHRSHQRRRRGRRQPHQASRS